MTIRLMPEARLKRPQNYQWDVPSDLFARWAERPVAADSNDPNTISIFDVIGEDPWSGDGVTAKRVAAALRSIGDQDVTVKINSPGGDLFEGIAIYNLLREHPAKVTIDIVGLAASAASIIAMAGDDVRMGRGTFIMVHNAWGMVIGNRHDMREAADVFEQFDSAIADIYAARVKLTRQAVERLMDDETFMDAREAVEAGFADVIADNMAVDAAAASGRDRRIMARRQLESVLARAGYSRHRRSELLAEIMECPAGRDAGRNAARDAGIDPASIRELIALLR